VALFLGLAVLFCYTQTLKFLYTIYSLDGIVASVFRSVACSYTLKSFVFAILLRLIWFACGQCVVATFRITSELRRCVDSTGAEIGMSGLLRAVKMMTSHLIVSYR